MDRIVHQGIEQFKQRVLDTPIHGLTIGKWARLLSTGNDEAIRHALQTQFDIKDMDITEILE